MKKRATPRLQLVGRQKRFLQDDEHDDRRELAADQRHVLEARIEAATLRIGHFGRWEAVFATVATGSCSMRATTRMVGAAFVA